MRSFKLSFSGKLSCTLSIALLGGITAAVSHANQDIVGGGHSAPTVIGVAANGASVVEIVTPNAQGLSHNTYDKYNVNQAGAVLNNSLKDGKSQLAGELNANPNLKNDQAAKVILNEVVSRNPSLLLGQQEVFGMAADYVLANPNGITCDGCGFINVPRASMVVGQAEIDQGKIKNLKTANNKNSLDIKGKGVSGSDVLDLVAPKINASGQIKAKQEINAFTGRNSVDYETKKVVNRQNREVGLDGYYVGGMQAGRINIVSTGAGNGVNLSGDIQTSDQSGLNVKAVSVINFVAADVKGNVSAIGQDVKLTGKISEKTETIQRDGNYSAHNGASKKRAEKESQSWKGTDIRGDKVVLAAKNSVNSTASNIQAKSLNVVGRKVNLDSQKLTSKNTELDHNWKYSWEHNQTRVNTVETQVGNSFRADETTIRATEYDVNIQGGLIEGKKQLSVRADKGNVFTNGSVEKVTDLDVGNKRNHTASLETGSWNIVTEQEHLYKTELAGDGAIGVSAAKNVNITGTDIIGSGDILLNANGKVNVGAQQISNNKVTRDNQVYWGGIGGGYDKDNNRSDKLQVASEIESKGMIIVSGDQGVQVQGSKIVADKGGYAQSKTGSVNVDNATNFSHEIIEQRNGTVFNITKDSQFSDEKTEKAKQSELVSNAKFDIISNQNIAIIGSLIKVAEQLNLKAVGNIDIEGARQTLDRQSKTRELRGSAYAGQDGDKQYRAGVGIELESTAEARSETSHLGSTVQGGTITVSSEKDVNIKGSTLKTDKGNAGVNAENIRITAQQDTAVVNKENKKAGFGVYAGGGMDRVTIGLESGLTKTGSEKETSTALESSSEISGDLSLNAKNALQYEGGKHQIGGALSENAATIQRKAATNSETGKTTTTTFKHDVGASADIGGITRPIEKAVNGLADGNPVGAFASVNAIGAPNANVTVKFSGGTKVEHSESSQATGVQIQAGSVAATADSIRDEATSYTATAGGIRLKTQDYANVAAANTKTVNTVEDKGEASLGVATSTGQDITITAKGKGGHSEGREFNSEAVVGGFNSVADIQITADKGIVLEGNQVRSEKGGLNLNSNGNVKLVQANNVKESSKNGFNVDLNLSAGISSSSKSGSGGIGGGANNADSQSVVAKAGEIAVNSMTLSGDNVLLQGMNGKADKVTVTAKQSAVISAAQGSSRDQGLDWSVNLGGGGGSTEGDKAAKNGSLKIGVNVKKSDQATTDYQAAAFTAKDINVSAGSTQTNAIHIAGGSLQGDNVNLTAQNGGIVIESRTNSEHKDNRAVKLGGGGSIKKVNAEDKTTQDGNADLSIAIEKKEKAVQLNSRIDGKQVTVKTGNDLTLSGANIHADAVKGDIGGNLTVESRKDSEQAFGFNLDLTVTNGKNNGALNGVMKAVPSTKTTDAVKGKVTAAVNSAAEQAGFAEHNPLTGKTAKPSSLVVSGSIVSQDQVVSAAGIQGGTVDLTVKNHTQLTGASVTAENGKPNLSSGSVDTKNIDGHNNRYSGEVTISNNIPLLIQEAVKDLKDGKFPLINGSISQESTTATAEIGEVTKR
ncbi:hypothetical protein OA57_07415 [Chelonobacter oris]|uniref:Filamentous haemagglutinin FhaB/tRNA nuclease CdiA-like TPS domain-containing protein n=1 Tax=Chelonobacter oris TaxID=505317 RepID=A0A0A3ASZ0_9PAST|nr:hemagglutinin repeat-containing protein [Chelonobacter oris]KGQ70155.1 hypothetical protein OA57_07415 [Chelonobacter oris]